MWRSRLNINFFMTQEKEYFIENFAMLLASGMDIIEALDAIKGEVHSKSLKKAISRLEEDIVSGSTLWHALEATKFLPKQVVSLVKTGEGSGQLHESLSVIVVQQEKNRAFRSKIRSAMMYPVFVLILALVVGIGIAWFILPRLANVFSQLNLALPLVTRILMDMGRYLGEHGQTVVPIFIAGMLILFYFIFVFKYTKIIGQKLLFIFPGVKNLIKEVEIARLGYIMGTLLRSGLPIIEALDSLSESTPLYDYRRIYVKFRNNINEGHSFHECFAMFPRFKKFIPIPIQGLIIAGERSGKLAETFLNISSTYEGKTELTTKNLSVILEPILLVIVWLGVVAVALAVILPIYGLVGGLNKP